jgi:NitT/TauT family transport system ATP-binding protein
MSMIEIADVTHTFPGGTTALAHTDLRIEENEFVSLVGRSGCGKSTLLMILAGLVIPTEGTVAVEGQEVRGPGRDRGVVFQQYTLFPWLTAQQNVEFALREAGVRRRDRPAQARENLELVGLVPTAGAADG